MKNYVVIFFLKLCRKLAGVWQLGNPYQRSSILKGDVEERFVKYSFKADQEEVRVWGLNNILATALYGGALINQKNEVYDRFVCFPWGKSLHPIFSFPYIGVKKGKLNKVIYLITPEAKGNYYHWMTDLLPRLMLIKKSNFLDFQERTLILHFPSRSYENDTLNLLNISAEKVFRLKPFEMVEAKDLIVTDHYSNERKFPKWKRILLNEFKEMAKPTFLPEKVYNKVYLYRGKQKVRRLTDEERLVKILKAKGFQIVDPQKLSLLEQITILKKAKIVVAMHGAALTNTIFCEEGSYVIELRSTFNSPEHFSSIAKAYNLNFETVSLEPARVQEKRHLANKENLILTKRSIEKILSKISTSEILLGSR